MLVIFWDTLSSRTVLELSVVQCTEFALNLNSVY